MLKGALKGLTFTAGVTMILGQAGPPSFVPFLKVGLDINRQATVSKKAFGFKSRRNAVYKYRLKMAKTLLEKASPAMVLAISYSPNAPEHKSDLGIDGLEIGGGGVKVGFTKEVNVKGANVKFAVPVQFTPLALDRQKGVVTPLEVESQLAVSAAMGGPVKFAVGTSIE